MPKTTILKRELNSVPLAELLALATEGDGVRHHCCYFYGGALPAIVVLAIGPAAQDWLEIVERYHQSMTEGDHEGHDGDGSADGAAHP